MESPRGLWTEEEVCVVVWLGEKAKNKQISAM